MAGSLGHAPERRVRWTPEHRVALRAPSEPKPPSTTAPALLATKLSGRGELPVIPANCSRARRIAVEHLTFVAPFVVTMAAASNASDRSRAGWLA